MLFRSSRARHHCRICGSCVCAACSPHQLALAAEKPPVRVCTKCNLRVGLLNQMTAVIDSIYSIRKLLPPAMFHTFQREVLDAVGGDALLGARQAAVGGAAAAATAAASTGAAAPLAAAAAAAMPTPAPATPASAPAFARGAASTPQPAAKSAAKGGSSASKA